MNDIEVSSIDLVEGGNVFKQGHYLTLGYVPRDENGETVDLSGKTLNVALWGRKGVVFEAAATYSGGVIRFTLDKMVPAGDYTVEFTVTSSTDAKYRKKFPTNQHSGRIAIKQSADDLGVVGIQVYTVAQLKAEQKALLDAAVSGFTVDSETKMARVSGTTTHPTIGARLEADKQATAAQLADKAAKGEVRVDTATKPINVSEMDTETKQLFTGGSVAVVGENAVGSENVKEKAITAKKTSFIKVSTNLIDKNSLLFGYNIDLTTGEKVASSVSSVSSMTEIVAGKPFYSTSFSRYAYYDAQQVFISAFTGNGLITPPVNAKFIQASTTSPETVMLNEGDVRLPYEPYYKPYIDGIVLNELFGRIVKSVNIQENAIGIEHLNIVDVSTNLFDPSSLITGFALNTTTGEPVENALNSISDFRKAEPATSYTKNFEGRLAFYDADYKFLYQGSISTLNSPTGTVYMRYVINNNQITGAQINEGSTLLSYEEFGSSLKDTIKIKTNNLSDDIELGQTPLAESKYYIEDLDLNGTYTAPVMEGKASSDALPIGNHSLADIYAFYDAIVTAYPSYVTKTLLGNDNWGNPIYRYDFKPQPIESTTNQTPFPKMLITSGTHGFERTAIWVLLQMMEEIANNWKSDSLLEVLRWNVHFIIVPIVNPTSYNNAVRKNDNGVDISRNFPEGWDSASSDPASSTYRGTAPLSELEAQYVNSIMTTEKDLLYVCDFHNYHTPGTPDSFMWIPGATNLTIAAGKHLVSKMSRKWKKDHSFLPQDDTTLYGKSDDGAPGGTIAKQAVALGYQSSLFEVCQRFELEPNFENRSAFVMQLGVEAFTNWILIVLKHSIMDFNKRV